MVWKLDLSGRTNFSTKPKKKSTLNKSPTVRRTKNSPSAHVGAKGLSAGDTYLVVHKSHTVTIKRLMLDDAMQIKQRLH